MTIFFGLCASVLLVLLSLAINRKSVVFLSALLVIATSAQYISLDKWVPVALNVVAFAYALSVPFEKKFPWLKSKKTIAGLFVIYTVLFFLINGFHLNIELFTYIASIAGVALMVTESPFVSKWLMFVTGISWTIYLFAVGAYGQIPGEVFFVSGVIFSLTYLYKNKSSNAEIPELSAVLMNRFKKSFSKKSKTLKRADELATS